MNSIKLRVLLVITVCFSLFACANFPETAKDKREVGEFGSNGELVLHHHTLKKEFPNGTLVDQFKTITLGGKLYLERSGIGISGSYIREKAPLKYDEKSELFGESAYLTSNSIIKRTHCRHYNCKCSKDPAAVTHDVDAQCTFSRIEKECACKFKNLIERVKNRDSSETEMKVNSDGKTDITYGEISVDEQIISYGHVPTDIDPKYALSICEEDTEDHKLNLDDWVE